MHPSKEHKTLMEKIRCRTLNKNKKKGKDSSLFIMYNQTPNHKQR